MIAVTGSAGFIGSNIVAHLNQLGRSDIMAVDYFDDGIPNGLFNNPQYLDHLQIEQRIDAREFIGLLESGKIAPTQIIHMGACSDTTQTDRDFMMSINLEYTKSLFRWCATHNVPLVYASSAATYGDGENGYDDACDPSIYKPLNIYGESKQLMDLWALSQTHTPPRWAGVKFFNVYGPREYHKGKMASVIYHSYNQIKQAGKVKLFKSHREGIPDGGQKRDFVFVEDVIQIVMFLLESIPSEESPNGIYNAGTGQARSFEDLVRATFAAMGKETNIEFIPMPEELRGKYQYFTQATCEKITRAGMDPQRTSLEEGAKKYVQFLRDNEGVYA